LGEKKKKGGKEGKGEITSIPTLLSSMNRGKKSREKREGGSKKEQPNITLLVRKEEDLKKAKGKKGGKKGERLPHHLRAILGGREGRKSQGSKGKKNKKHTNLHREK